MKRRFVEIVGLLMVVLFAVVVAAAPIPVSEVAKYVDKTVTVEGKVLKVGHDPKSGNYFLDFTQDRKGFTVVVFGKVVPNFEKAKIDFNALNGKSVQVTGKIDNNPKYGIQIILNEPSAIKIVGGTESQKPGVPTTTGAAKPATVGKIIPVAEVEKYIDQSGTVEGKVFKVGYSSAKNIYFLNFTEQRDGFAVVSFDQVSKQFAAKKIDPNSFQGKIVQVTGKIVKPPQYGVEMVLDSPDNIKIIK
jgi:DNA/RNA endonuclease YhcR with UshA esterase domain